MKKNSLKDKYHTLIFGLVMIALSHLVVTGVFVYFSYPYYRPYFNPENFELLLESVKNDWQLYLGVISGFAILPLIISIVSTTLVAKLIREGKDSLGNPIFYLPVLIAFIGSLAVYLIFSASNVVIVHLPGNFIFFVVIWWTQKKPKNEMISNSK